MRWHAGLLAGIICVTGVGALTHNTKRKTATVTASMPPLPPASSQPSANVSRAFVEPKPRTNWLAWTWDTNRSQYFEVWTTTNINGPWSRWTNVLTDRVQLPRDGAPARFYRVRAVDFGTGLPGPWASR